MKQLKTLPNINIDSLIDAYEHGLTQMPTFPQPTIHTTEKTVSSTNGAGQTGELHVEKWNQILISHSA